ALCRARVRGRAFYPKYASSTVGNTQWPTPSQGSDKGCNCMSEATAPAFNLELNEDVRDIQEWAHGFAADVIRPAAAEWDEREETPWPVLQEAAKIGLYSLDFFANQWMEPSGLGIPVAFEELYWGDPGIALAITGSALAAVSVASTGTTDRKSTRLNSSHVSISYAVSCLKQKQ